MTGPLLMLAGALVGVALLGTALWSLLAPIVAALGDLT